MRIRYPKPSLMATFVLGVEGVKGNMTLYSLFLAFIGDGTSFPPSRTVRHKCNTKALVILDGCATCLNCRYSKCG